MIPLSEALHILDRVVGPIDLSVETVGVRQALGRIAARDQVCRLDLPPFDKAAVDGYAVMADDERDTYRIVESVPAGSVPSRDLEPGTAIKVMTGAPVPMGAGKVIMVEKTREESGELRVLAPEAAANICWKAEDRRRGEVVLNAPVQLGAVEVANAIAAGITEVAVFRRLRVSIISTGDEVVDAPEQLTAGKILNANGPLLAMLCEQHGMQVVSDELVGDERAATEAALQRALGQSDMVVISGGVSVGDLDFVGSYLSEGEFTLHFNRVATKPGKPMTLATSAQKPVFGLPGNPVSVYVAFYLYVLRAARRMTGIAPATQHLALTLARDFKRKKAERLEYVPCRLTGDGGVVPVAFHGSAHLLALLQAHGFFVVPRDVTRVAAGEHVRVFMTAHSLLGIST